MNKLLLGAHMSISKGFKQAFYDAQSIGCTAMQLFLHSNRQWAMHSLTTDKINSFNQGKSETDITTIVVHASYLLNLASSNKETRIKSLTTLIKELQHCNQLNIPYLIMHPGSAGAQNRTYCLSLIAEGIDQALQTAGPPVMVLLENMGGAGGLIGATLEELRDLRLKIKHKQRVGFCFDTCHGWVAGYDFSHSKTYTTFWNHFDAVIGLQHLKAFHLNDSLKEKGSLRDRHADIGSGTIGLEVFSLLMNDKRFSSIPKILETPTDSNALQSFHNNILVLKKLISV